MKTNIQNSNTLVVNIQQVLNLLNCFEDFCDFEGDFDSCETEEELRTKAIVFAERLKCYDSLIFASKELLRNTLTEFYEANQAI